MRSQSRNLAVAILLGLAGIASATDAPISGKKLTLRDTPSPRLVFVSNDTSIPSPTLSGTDDPTFFGAALRVTSGNGELATLEMPASGWTSSGSTFRFKNSQAPAGISPVRVALIRPGRRLKIVARHPALSLDEPSQDPVGLVLETGTLRYCASFGGTIVIDVPGKFGAKTAPAPMACPPRPTTTTSSTSSTSSTTSPMPTTSSSTSSTSTSTMGTNTTTSTSSTSTTTLVAGCAPPPVALGGIEFTIGAGAGTCGGPAFTPPSSGPFTGQLEDNGMNVIAQLGSSCLYVGGGLSNSLPPAHIPDGAVARLDVSGAAGLSLTLAASAGSGPLDCTLGAGPGSHCANGATGTNGMGLCTTDADCGGGVNNCVLDGNCFFGPPIPLPSPVPATSSCIVNVIGSDACGTADLLTGGSSLSVALMARLYLTSDAVEPCPRCIAGTCTAGQRAGLACGGGIGSTQTSNDCPPTDSDYVGQLMVNPLQVSTGASVMTDPGGLFCPGQTTLGAFGLANARTIRETGVPLIGGPTLLAGTLAGIFCAPSSASALIDNAEDIPGPAAVSVPGQAAVCLSLIPGFCL